MKRLLSDGEKLAPRQWKGQIEKLTEECRELSGKSGEYVCRLAFVEVIQYNRRMYLSELNRKPQESCHIELQETVLGEGRIADGEERKTSVLQELKRRQEKIRIQEEQKKTEEKNSKRLP